MENKGWIIVCIIGGILMITGSTVGSIAFFEMIYGLLATYLSPTWINIIDIAMKVLGYVAAGGGISVIVGALIVALGFYRLGRFIIALGAGMGLLGFIIFIITSIVGGTIVNDMTGIILEVVNGGYGFLGVLLTIVARSNLKEKEEVVEV